MTVENFQLVFERMMDRQPFQPFTVELVGGHRFEVDHPRAMVLRNGVAVFLEPGGAPIWFDHDSITQIAGDIAEKRAS